MNDLRDQIRDFYGRQCLSEASVRRILAGSPRIVRPVWGRRLAAMAAAIAVLAGVLIFQRHRVPHGEVPFAAVSESLRGWLTGPDPVDLESGDMAAVRSWLAARGAPDFQIPAGARDLRTHGCRELKINGRNGYVVCFWLDPEGNNPERMVHLCVVRRDGFTGTPGGQPDFRSESGWNLVSWSEGDLVYTLASRQGFDTLRTVLRS